MSKTVVLTGSHARFHRDRWLNGIVEALTGDKSFYKIAVPLELLADPVVMAFVAKQVGFARTLGGAQHLIVVCEDDQNIASTVACLRAHRDLSDMSVQTHRTDFMTLELVYKKRATWAKRCMDPRNNAAGTPNFASMVMRDFGLSELPHVLSWAGGAADHIDDFADSDPIVRIGGEHIMDSLHGAEMIGRLIATGHTGCRKLFCAPMDVPAQVAFLSKRLRAYGHHVTGRYPGVAVEMHVGHTGDTHLTHFTQVEALSPTMQAALVG